MKLDWLIALGRRLMAEEKDPQNECTDPEICTYHKPATADSTNKTPVVVVIKESKIQQELRQEQNKDIAVFRVERGGRLG
jgi:hypothetical protein